MLLDAWSGQYKYPDLVKKVMKEKDWRYGQSDRRPMIAPQRGPAATMGVGKSIDMILIEAKASGISLRQTLAADGIKTWGFNPGNADKTTRTHIVSPIPKDGIIWVPESVHKPGKFISWAEPWVEEVCSYAGPGTTLHDDLLDTTTQAWRVIDWNWLHHLENQTNKAKQLKGPDERAREEQSTARAQGHLRNNPYAQ
jgi:predicted phage terminase large subunit-like protein